MTDKTTDAGCNTPATGAVGALVDQGVRPVALTFADWLDGEAGAGGTNWNRKIAGAASELRRLHAEAGQLRARIAELEATEEGAKVAFGHVVDAKRAAEKECKSTQELLDAAYAQIRRLGRA
jgi:hypothetical protein